MPTHGADFPAKSLKIKMSREEKKEMEAAEEDYHGGASVSVPFMWESQPGTPKAKFRDNGSLLSPLTPPPSYFSTTRSPKPLRKSSKTNFLNTIFQKRSVKASLPSSPASTSSSSSSASDSPRPFPTWFKSSSVPSSSMTPPGSRPERVKARSPRRLSFDSRVDEDDDDDDQINIESPVSTLFFGRGGNEGPRGCYPKLVKVFMRDFK